MSTLTLNAPHPPAVGGLLDHAALANTTVLALALDIPTGGSAHRADLAAVALRQADARLATVRLLRCRLHAGMPGALIAEHCHLPVDEVLDRSPAAVALIALDRHLTTAPYLLVAHGADALADAIAQHGEEYCPHLAALPILEIAHLAARVVPDRTDGGIADLAAALGMDRARGASRTADQAALTAEVFARLLTLAVEATTPGPRRPVPLGDDVDGTLLPRFPARGVGGTTADD
jgi:hypothetical protein